MHTGFLISQTTWSSSPEAAQRASPLPPRLARTIGWPGKHSGSSRGLLGPGGGQGPEHSPPSVGQDGQWPGPWSRASRGALASALPAVPRPPGCTLIGAASGLLVTPTWPQEADPSPSRSAGLTGTQPGHTEPPGHGGSCRENPAFLALGLALSLHPSCLPLGVFPTCRPHPPQESLTEPPAPTPRVFSAFLCQAHGNKGSPGFMAGLCFTPLGLGGTDSTPISQLDKTEVQRGEETCLQSPEWKVRDRTGLAWLRNPAQDPLPAAWDPLPAAAWDPLPAAQGLRQGQARWLGPGPGLQEGSL